MKNILVPVDFSPVSRRVVAEAARLARLIAGRIILLHVVQPPAIVTDYGPLLGEIIEYTGLAEKAADRRLARLSAKLHQRGQRARAVRATHYPVQRILEQAKKSGADYIVIGSHGHTAFYDLLVGSTTSGVLKRATCPVVVVPMPGRVPRRPARKPAAR